jgi:arginine decarboxylase
VVLGKLPQSFFLTRGSAEGYTPLNAFDGTLINASIVDLNVVKVSNLISPGSSEIQPRELPCDAIVPITYALITSDIPGEIISAAVAVPPLMNIAIKSFK